MLPIVTQVQYERDRKNFEAARTHTANAGPSLTTHQHLGSAGRWLRPD
jgi:hypothetical protein